MPEFSPISEAANDPTTGSVSLVHTAFAFFMLAPAAAVKQMTKRAIGAHTHTPDQPNFGPTWPRELGSIYPLFENECEQVASTGDVLCFSCVGCDVVIDGGLGVEKEGSCSSMSIVLCWHQFGPRRPQSFVVVVGAVGVPGPSLGAIGSGSVDGTRSEVVGSDGGVGGARVLIEPCGQCRRVPAGDGPGVAFKRNK